MSRGNVAVGHVELVMPGGSLLGRRVRHRVEQPAPRQAKLDPGFRAGRRGRVENVHAHAEAAPHVRRRYGRDDARARGLGVHPRKRRPGGVIPDLDIERRLAVDEQPQVARVQRAHAHEPRRFAKEHRRRTQNLHDARLADGYGERLVGIGDVVRVQGDHCRPARPQNGVRDEKTDVSRGGYPHRLLAARRTQPGQRRQQQTKSGRDRVAGAGITATHAGGGRWIVRNLPVKGKPLFAGA